MKPTLLIVACVLAVIALGVLADGGGPPAPATGKPLRILPTTADQVDFLSVLVDPDRIVALPEQALTWSRVAEDERWRALPRFSRFLAEPIVAHTPDLVLVSPFAEPDTVLRLEESGLRVVKLGPRSDLDDALSGLKSLAELVEAEERLAPVIADIERRRAALDAARTKRPPLRLLSYTDFGSGGWSAGSDTTIDAAMKLAGFENAVADREGHFRISHEEILALDPDLIVVSGEYGESGDTISMMLASASALSSARAIAERRIVRLPPRLAATSSQELLTAAEALIREVDAILAREAAEEGR